MFDRIFKEAKIEWTDMVRDELTRFFTCMLDNSKDEELDKKITDCFQMFIAKVVADGFCQKESEVGSNYVEYFKRMIQLADSGMFNDTFVTSVPEFADPIMMDLKDIFALVRQPIQITTKMIQWLTIKFEPPYVFHCIVPAIYEELLQRNGPFGDLYFKRIFELSSLLIETCCWPIMEKHPVKLTPKHLEVSREFEVLTIFNGALLCDLVANLENEYVRDNILGLPYTMKVHDKSVSFIKFLAEKSLSTVNWLIKTTGYVDSQMAQKLAQDNDQKAMAEVYQICEVAIQYLSSFFNTIHRFSELEMEPVVEEPFLVKLQETMVDLNNRMNNLIKSQVYCTPAYVGAENDVLEALMSGLQTCLNFGSSHKLADLYERGYAARRQMEREDFERFQSEAAETKKHDPVEYERKKYVHRGNFGKGAAEFQKRVEEHQAKKDNSE